VDKNLSSVRLDKGIQVARSIHGRRFAMYDLDVSGPVDIYAIGNAGFWVSDFWFSVSVSVSTLLYCSLGFMCRLLHRRSSKNQSSKNSVVFYQTWHVKQATPGQRLADTTGTLQSAGRMSSTTMWRTGQRKKRMRLRAEAGSFAHTSDSDIASLFFCSDTTQNEIN